MVKRFDFILISLFFSLLSYWIECILLNFNRKKMVLSLFCLHSYFLNAPIQFGTHRIYISRLEILILHSSSWRPYPYIIPKHISGNILVSSFFDAKVTCAALNHFRNDLMLVCSLHTMAQKDRKWSEQNFCSFPPFPTGRSLYFLLVGFNDSEN